MAEQRQLFSKSEPRRASLQSQHSSFEDSATVHPLRSLLLAIKDEIDQKMVHLLICSSKDQLGDQYDKVVKDCDIFDFFNVLESKLGTEYAVDFIETCLDNESLYGEFGLCKLSDKVEQYKAEKAQYLSECPLDPYFVGRGELMEDIIQTLQDQGSEYAGVVIYGKSGVGTTSLASEVCHKLQNSRKHWLITHVNLRGRETLEEILHALLLQLSDSDWRWNLDSDSLKSQVLKVIRKGLKFRKIIWLDNMDHLGYSEDKIKQLTEFLKELTCVLRTDQSCQIKLLITLAAKPSTENQFTDQAESFAGDFYIKKINDLSCEEVNKSLKKFIHLQQEVDEGSLCDTTRRNPLLFRIVVSSLHTGTYMNGNITSRMDYSQPLSDDLFFERCIDRVFQRLDKKSQKLLTKLSVFKTVPFCLESALFVIADDNEVFEMSKHKKQKLLGDLLVEMTHLRLSNFIEDDSKLSPIYDFEGSKVSPTFSLHPCIFRYLNTLNKTNEFIIAKLYFCKYFCFVICKFIKELDSAVTTISKILWYKKSMHFKTLCNYVISDQIELSYEHGHCSLLLCQYRIWKMVQTVVGLSDQLCFILQQKKFANESRHGFASVMWTLLLAEYYINKNQTELVVQAMSEIPEEIIPGIVMNTEKADRRISQLKKFLKNISEQSSGNKVKEVVLLCAFYCRVRGLILLKDQDFIKAGNQYLKLAFKLFSGAYGKSEVRKEIKQACKTEALELQKLLSKVEITKDLRKSESFIPDPAIEHNSCSGTETNLNLNKVSQPEMMDPLFGSAWEYQHIPVSSKSSATLEYGSERDCQNSVELRTQYSRQRAWSAQKSNRKRTSKESEPCSDKSIYFEDTPDEITHLESPLNRDIERYSSNNKPHSENHYPRVPCDSSHRVSLTRLHSQNSVTSLMDSLTTDAEVPITEVSATEADPVVSKRRKESE